MNILKKLNNSFLWKGSRYSLTRNIYFFQILFLWEVWVLPGLTTTRPFRKHNGIIFSNIRLHVWKRILAYSVYETFLGRLKSMTLPGFCCVNSCCALRLAGCDLHAHNLAILVTFILDRLVMLETIYRIASLNFLPWTKQNVF